MINLRSTVAFTSLKDDLRAKIDNRTSVENQRKEAERQAEIAKQQLYAKLQYTERLDHTEISELESIAAGYQSAMGKNQFAPKPEVLNGFSHQEISILAASYQQMVNSYWEK